MLQSHTSGWRLLSSPESPQCPAQKLSQWQFCDQADANQIDQFVNEKSLDQTECLLITHLYHQDVICVVDFWKTKQKMKTVISNHVYCQHVTSQSQLTGFSDESATTVLSLLLVRRL